MDWKENANLFVNGKFKIKETEDFNDIFNIHGLFVDHTGDKWIIPESIDYSFHVDDCTLIARPISDMTDKEWEDAPHNKHAFKKVFREDGNRVTDVEGFLYFLSIGVYPFNQEHFNDGTVLNINEVT